MFDRMATTLIFSEGVRIVLVLKTVLTSVPSAKDTPLTRMGLAPTDVKQLR